MNVLKLLSPFLLTVCLTSCSGPTPEQKPIPVMKMKQEERIKIDLSLLASPKDPICEMSLADGIADTLTVDGKIYGFCSSGCKKEFLASLSENPKP